jgi:transposase
MVGYRFCRIMRLETPLRLFTSTDTDTLGGQHGKGVKQKSGLNRAILDQGWPEFRRQLEYKTQWRGHMLVAVPAHHTSQTWC